MFRGHNARLKAGTAVETMGDDDKLDLNKMWNMASISHGPQMPSGRADDVLHPCEPGVAWSISFES